jgi:FlaA1/EpsC-like NDP-sugar epimerase
MRLLAKQILIILCDLVAAATAWMMAFALRFNLEIPEHFFLSMISNLIWVVPLHVSLFFMLGIHRAMWRFVSVKDLQAIILAAILATTLIGAGVFMFRIAEVPRSVLILHPLLLIMAMGGARLAYRGWREYRIYGHVRIEGEPVLVLGAGDAAMMLLRELKRGHQWCVAGLLDDAGRKRGRSLDGFPILGGVAEIANHARRLNVRHAIIAMPSASVAQRRHAAELATEAGLQVLTVPSLADILSGSISISQVRRVELEDLLGRDRVELDNQGLHRLLTGKVVMITGAGGSIGAELCRQIAKYSPQLLVLYEISEFALYAIEQEFSGKSVRCIVGDVKDLARLEATFSTYRPDIVFHAAAYKHVPMMENENAWEAVRNNVLGTLRVARAAANNGVSEFVFISTDKAVNPANVMGASKRLAELVCQALQPLHPETRLVMVRFGNVLGSSGSVIPKFREQIAHGGPVTVTHPDIIRYFMLIPEAAQLVLQAGLMANMESEGGKIFVLDMGEPVRIVDLARDMIRLSGLGENDIQIKFTGLRPGEKLYEELLADGETTLPTPHPKLRIAKPGSAPSIAWLLELESWLSVPVRTELEVKNELQRRIPEYQSFALQGEIPS